MGYRPKRRSFKLDFSGTEHDGLEVTVRAVPLAVMLDVATADPASPATSRQALATLGYAMESWNVEDDDGQPVPADLDGLMSQEPALAFAVMQKWIESLAGGA